MMTEAEAKTKWCPESRYELGDVSVNRWKQPLPEYEPNALNPVPCRCIASACMAWRWSEWEQNDNPSIHERSKGIKGYCGLSGKQL
jgi:hypothetical protein